MDDALPASLRASGFTVRAGFDAGLTRARMRSGQLARPFQGVRATAEPKTALERALAYAPLLRPWQGLGGVSALAVLGLPVPRPLRGTTAVEIVSQQGRGHPERSGVRVRRVPAERLELWEIDGARVASAASAWALMADRCSVHELVVLGDAIVSDAANYPDRRLRGPLATIEALRAVTDGWKGTTGASALRAALPRIRERVESPRESDMRLIIADAGMPEPEVQVTIHDPATGLRLGRADLLHREARVVEEYEGDGHRAKGQWDRDIQKYRDFERIGLHVVRATHRDFVPSAELWLHDLAAVLERRTAAAERRRQIVSRDG